MASLPPIPDGFRLREPPPIPEGFKPVSSTIGQRVEERLRQEARDLPSEQVGLIGMGSMVNDAIQNVKGLFGEPEPVPEGRRILEEERGGRFQVGRGIGAAGAFSALPGASGSLATRSAVGAAEGGATAGLITPQGESVLENVVIGAGFGAAAPVVVNGVARAIQRFAKTRLQVVNPDGTLTDEAIDIINKTDDVNDAVVKELKRSGMSAKEAERFNLFRKEGLDPTKAQITQKASDFQSQEELAKISGPVRSRLDEQSVLLTQKVDDLITKLGGEAVDSADAGRVVAQTATKIATDADDAVQAAYRAAREAAPVDKVVRPDALVAKLRQLASDDRASDGLIRAVAGDLKSRGLVKGKSLKIQGRASVEIAEEVRKNINAVASESPFKRSRLARELKEALDADVQRAVGDDIFKEARAAKAAFAKSLEKGKVSKFDRNQKSLVRDIIENKVDPDRLVNNAILNKSGRADDLEALKGYLHSGTKAQVEAGEAAWNELRSATLRDALVKATSGPKTELDAPVFSGVRFKRALNQVGDQKMRVLFSEAERTQIATLARIGELRIPVERTAVGKGPTAQAMNDLLLTSLADPKTAHFLRIVRNLTRARGLSREAQAALGPLAPTEQALSAARLPALPGSVGAVAGDNL